MITKWLTQECMPNGPDALGALASPAVSAWSPRGFARVRRSASPLQKTLCIGTVSRSPYPCGFQRLHTVFGLEFEVGRVYTMACSSCTDSGLCLSPQAKYSA